MSVCVPDVQERLPGEACAPAALGRRERSCGGLCGGTRCPFRHRQARGQSLDVLERAGQGLVQLTSKTRRGPARRTPEIRQVRITAQLPRSPEAGVLARSAAMGSAAPSRALTAMPAASVRRGRHQFLHRDALSQHGRPGSPRPAWPNSAWASSGAAVRASLSWAARSARQMFRSDPRPDSASCPGTRPAGHSPISATVMTSPSGSGVVMPRPGTQPTASPDAGIGQPRPLRGMHPPQA